MAITYQNSIQFSATSGTSFGGSFNAGAGTDRILLVFTSSDCNPAQTASGVTYNGVALTRYIGPISVSGGSGRIRYDAWYLVNPASGSNTLTATFTGTINSNGAQISAAVYNGAIQSSSAINKNSNANTGSSDNTTISTSVTPDVAGCWIVGFCQDQDQPPDVQGAYTPRLTSGSWDIISDSNASVPLSSQTMQWNIGGPRVLLCMVIALRPTPIVGPANLKSLDTNVKANIKSYNTNVLANIKSINTNA